MKILGFGAVLWDDIADDPKTQGAQNIGGSVFNVMVHAKRLGNEASMLTAIGDDPLGDRTVQTMKELSIGTELVKIVSEPTCLVRVTFDENKQPSYSCDDRVSWDFITVNQSDIDIINNNRYDYFCFGTLEQRNTVSRNALIQVLEKCRFDKVYLDLTLRPPFYSKEIMVYSLKKCNIAKMNMEEAIVTNSMLEVKAASVGDFMASLRQLYSIDMVIVTDGEDGAYFSNRETCGHCPGYTVDLVDPVGAGDAFSAGLLHKLKKGYPLEQACDFACRMGAMICSKKSSIPDYSNDEVNILSRRHARKQERGFIWL